MLKKITILFFIFISLQASNKIEIDINQLQQAIKQNQTDIKDRLLLAKYYENKKDYDKALKLLNEVLKINKKNRYAISMKKEIITLKRMQVLTKKYGNLNKYINNLYKKNKYKKILNFYIKYNPKLSPDVLIKIARIAMWEGKYKLSLKILDKLNQTNLDTLEIKAYDYLYEGNIIKANQLFSILYNSTGEKDYGIKLMQTYLQLGDALDAKRVLYSLKYKLTKKEYNQYLKEINKKLFSYINYLKNKYNKNPTFTNLKNLAINLYSYNPQEAIAIVKNYVSIHPNNIKANILLAKLYTWNGETNKASEILNKYINSNNYQAKLLYGKILAWNGMYKKAIIFLSDVYQNGNKKQKYEALKMLGFIQMWQNHKKEAKKIFKKLLKINPNDTDIKEALMILNGDILPLINKYKKLVKKYPNNMDYILKLANLYYMLPNYKEAAKYYEIYLQNNPDKIEIYKTLGDIYLQIKKYYKGFADWEYYAAIKNTPKAYLELAKRYYWNGFTKEALDILNKILNKYPKYKPAIILKAKILKINPRFLNYTNQTAIEKYFTNRAQKILIYGDRSYFAGFYSTAAQYYKEYLFINPTDNKIREKYAYSLEFSGKYKLAAGEFYNLLWEKQTPLLEYHYAYCLQQIGKLKEAKKIYEKLLNQVPKPIPKKIKIFLNNWKKAWESMNFNKYSSFYGKNIVNNIYWKLKKQYIFKHAGFISVGIYNPLLLSKKENIYKIRFYQVYASIKHKDKGYKTLWIKCNKNRCFIIKEKWIPGIYNPSNPENALIIHIKEQLNLINKKLNKTLSIPGYIPLKKVLKTKNKKIQLPIKNIKRDNNINKIVKNLDITQLKQVKILSKNIISKEIPKKINYKLLITLYHFHDNQKTHYNHIQAIFLKNFNNFDAGIFFRFFQLNQNSNKHTGNIIAGVFKNNKYKLILGSDNAKNSNLYLNFNTKLFNHNLNILYENLVYSRKTICSLNHQRLKIELSRYLQLTSIRGLWYSIAGEYIDDGNLVFTPQIDYDFYANKIGKNPYALYFSGWYQFNSKQTTCYYSPDKTDSNLIGIKFYPYTKFANIMLKGGIGYSFWDQSFLYNLAFKFSKKLSIFNLNAQCNYSNTSSINAPNNYRSYECFINMEKHW